MPIEPREVLPRKEIVKRIQNYVRPFRVTSGNGFDLKEFDPGDTRGLKMEKGEAADLLQRGSEWLAMEQDMLYAQDRWSLLLVFQAMDAAGKDGTIKHVMSGVNPQGCQVFSFKQPSREGDATGGGQSIKSMLDPLEPTIDIALKNFGGVGRERSKVPRTTRRAGKRVGHGERLLTIGGHLGCAS